VGSVSASYRDQRAAIQVRPRAAPVSGSRPPGRKLAVVDGSTRQLRTGSSCGRRRSWQCRLPGRRLRAARRMHETLRAWARTGMRCRKLQLGVAAELDRGRQPPRTGGRKGTRGRFPDQLPSRSPAEDVNLGAVPFHIASIRIPLWPLVPAMHSFQPVGTSLRQRRGRRWYLLKPLAEVCAVARLHSPLRQAAFLTERGGAKPRRERPPLQATLSAVGLLSNSQIRQCSYPRETGIGRPCPPTAVAKNPAVAPGEFTHEKSAQCQHYCCN